jgi:hypothetical protein
MTVFVLGLVALAAIVAATLAVITLAQKQALKDAPPSSQPTDFVAPVSSGGYRWRQTDETLEEFHARIARENAQAEKKTGGR